MCVAAFMYYNVLPARQRTAYIIIIIIIVVMNAYYIRTRWYYDDVDGGRRISSSRYYYIVINVRCASVCGAQTEAERRGTRPGNIIITIIIWYSTLLPAAAVAPIRRKAISVVEYIMTILQIHGRRRWRRRDDRRPPTNAFVTRRTR